MYDVIKVIGMIAWWSASDQGLLTDIAVQQSLTKIHATGQVVGKEPMTWTKK